MRTRLIALYFVCLFVLLAACGTPSKEDVMKKLSGKWDDSKGYELEASMEIKTGAEPRLYDVTVWHTKPDFYRVEVTQAGSKDAQMIVRNKEGVFVVTPSLGKTYKFQSDWPSQNSMAYLIGTLAEDIHADKNATMKEEEKVYIFETATRNNHKKVLPTQQIHVDKKTLLPKHVSVLNESQEEQIRITFNKITLGVEREASDYDVKVDEKQQQGTDSSADSSDEETQDEEETVEPEANTDTQTFYPTELWEGITLQSEESTSTENGTRYFMTYSDGKKEFVVIQEPAAVPDNQLPVSMDGDPVDLGFAVAALTDTSIRWEQHGISFFVASNTLSADELIEVAASMQPQNTK